MTKYWDPMLIESLTNDESCKKAFDEFIEANKAFRRSLSNCSDQYPEIYFSIITGHYGVKETTKAAVVGYYDAIFKETVRHDGLLRTIEEYKNKKLGDLKC